MPHLTPHDVMTMFMALAVLLGCAKLAAELMQKIGQPSILGEISVPRTDGFGPLPTAPL
jgi:hypothetical protein